MKKILIIPLILIFLYSVAYGFDYNFSQSFISGNTNTTRPDQNVNVTDTVFGTTYRRISNAQTENTGDNNLIIPVYSRWSPLNSDGTKLYLQQATGNPDAIMYNAVTKAKIKIMPTSITIDGSPGTFYSMEANEIRWDKSGSYPNRFYWVSGMKFYQYDTATDTATTIRDFSSDFPTCNLIKNDTEGDSSSDSRYWVWMAMNGTTMVAIFTYDKQTNTILGTCDYAKYQSLGGQQTQTSWAYHRPNMVDMAPSGSKCVLLLTHAWDDRSYTPTSTLYLDVGTVWDGPHAWDLDFTDPVKVARTETHSGWAYDLNGNEMWVSQNNGNDTIEARDIQTGATTTMAYHSQFGWNNGFHFARMPSTCPGWILMSTYSTSNTSAGDNQLIMLELKSYPNARWWRLGHMHNAYDEYYAEGFAPMSQNGTRLWWGAKWPGQNYIDTYEMDLPSTWVSDLNGTANPPNINTISLPSGYVGTAYSKTLSASNGTPPYTWSVVSGSLPAGLSLAAATGIISGTPTSTQTASFTLRCTDNEGQYDQQALALSILIASGGGSTFNKFKLEGNYEYGGNCILGGQ